MAPGKLELIPMCTYSRIALPEKETDEENAAKTGYLSVDDLEAHSKMCFYSCLVALYCSF